MTKPSADRLNEYRKSKPPGCPDDIWCSGEWLAEELRALDCQEAVIYDICFATGQRQAMELRGDLWAIAEAALERYKKGDWDKPGPELADRLFKEKIKSREDAMKWLKMLIQRSNYP